MLTDDIVVTRNEELSADTFNIDLCDFMSLWCALNCYGRKLYGRAFVARQWHSDFVDGKVVTFRRPSLYLRPFTVAGDVPKRAADRRKFLALARKLFPRYKKVWIPTRSWSQEDSLPFLADVLAEHGNLAVTLSFDGSMRIKDLMTATSMMGAFNDRVGLATVIDTTGKATYTADEQERVNALVPLGIVKCPKTYGTGSCHTCGRLCWAENRDKRLSALGVPIVGFKYHT